MLRGHRDFNNREEYDRFLAKLFGQLNAGRKKRFALELEVLNSTAQNPIARPYDLFYWKSH